MSYSGGKGAKGLMGGLGSPLPPGTSALSSVFSQPEVKGLYYNGVQLVLDGYNFIGCRFDNCQLAVNSLNFNLIRCVIDESTVISYGSSVLKVIELFNSRYDWAYEHFPGFVPTKNPDGTITIADRGR